MSEGAQEYRATEGLAADAGMSIGEALDFQLSQAHEELEQAAAAVRQHVELHPFAFCASAEALEEMRRLTLAVDQLDRLTERLEHEGGAEAELPAGETVFDESWRRGFLAGALAQHAGMSRFATGRGWVKVASAIQLMPIVEAPPAPANPGRSPLLAGPAIPGPTPVDAGQDALATTTSGGA